MKERQVGIQASCKLNAKQNYQTFTESKPIARKSKPHAVTDHDRREKRELQVGRKAKCKENNKPRQNKRNHSGELATGLSSKEP